DPPLGRFLSRDRLHMSEGRVNVNKPYLYVRNSPLNHTDPSGLAPKRPPSQDDPSTWSHDCGEANAPVPADIEYAYPPKEEARSRYCAFAFANAPIRGCEREIFHEYYPGLKQGDDLLKACQQLRRCGTKCSHIVIHGHGGGDVGWVADSVDKEKKPPSKRHE